MQVINVGCNGHNAYLVADKKTAVIDGVCEAYTDEYINNIKKHTSHVDYVICNHASPDMVGSLKGLLECFGEAKVIATTAGMRNLKAILNSDFDELVAKDKEKLDLGECELEFLITPNLNWPDTMMTKCKNSLFSGMVFCGGREYFKNNFLPFVPFVLGALDRTADIDEVYPVLGEKKDNGIFNQYREWANEKTDNSVLIVYDSLHGYTKEMAEAIFDEFGKNDIKVRVLTADDACGEDINSCSALIMGTPTINRNASYKIMRLLADIDAIRIQRKPCFIFGSYGWGGEGTYILYNFLKNLKMNIPQKPCTVNFKMGEDEKAKLTAEINKFIKDCLRR